ncbi:MAG: hypothetical protein DRI24_22750 [Deltaproteobacteria bacterium]|nr:MAG: hypothetical protein DRI24_22750 [Deltaproteobacteria bacterium]
MPVQGNPLGPTVTDVKEEYDPNVIRRLIEYLRTLEENIHFKNQNLSVVGAPDAAGRRPHLILRSPNGNLWQVEVDNAGALGTTLLPSISSTGIRGRTAGT